ncbi:hypothetical protein [Pseudophaeobacter sp. 1A16562]|uniref:hypothetical protein n=1 Tax=Pseudophaeobacter sp. 1A16562 TaxID=3098143 RepID=UPI0034D48D48
MAKPKYRDITIRGVTYQDAKTAAAAHGVGRNTVLKALRKGRLDGVGLDRKGIPEMPVRIRGKDFKNAAAAARHLGVSRSAIYAALSAGDPDRVGRKRISPLHCSKAFAVGGLRWPSLRAASIDLGFCPEYVSKAYRLNRKSAKHRILAAAMRLAHQRQSGLTGGGDGI